MEFGSQHERKQMRRVTELEDGKRLLPKPKTRVELPFDVIVSILTRLPAIHLRRMRSVCRSWILLISDSRFIMEYSKFRTNVTRRPYIVSLHHCFGLQYGYKMKFFPEGDDYHQEFDMCEDLVGDQICTMSNSCDGLICIAGNYFTYLVNPSIKKVRALPKRSWKFNIHSVGLGFNDSTEEYKVVRLFHGRRLRCEVYTVGNLHSPSCWKVVDSPPFEPLDYCLPIFVNGAIHWTINYCLKEVTQEIALSFDIKREKFGVILHPEGSSRPPHSIVVELGGLVCLACTHHDEVHMDIWALKDYINREWTKQYSIDLSTMDYYWNNFALWNRSVSIHDGKIVFCNGYGWMSYYDPRSKSFVHIHAWSHFGYDTAYAESIVWPMARI